MLRPPAPLQWTSTHPNGSSKASRAPALQGGQQQEELAAAGLQGLQPLGELLLLQQQHLGPPLFKGEPGEWGQQQQQQEWLLPDSYDAALAAAAANQPAAAAGERGTLLDVWCQMQLLLSGAALLPHTDQVR